MMIYLWSEVKKVINQKSYFFPFLSPDGEPERCDEGISLSSAHLSKLGLNVTLQTSELLLPSAVFIKAFSSSSFKTRETRGLVPLNSRAACVGLNGRLPKISANEDKRPLCAS